MEVPWRFHGVLTQIPTKISQNLEQKRRPYCMNDAGSMEVRWSFHGGLMMEFPCSFHLFFTLHPCQDIPGQIGVIYIKTPWNLHQTCIINTIGPLQGNWEDLQNIPEKSM